ncbi:MAG: membrane integrity-associated transporter subunit PqiC [Chromatiales bacterium]
MPARGFVCFAVAVLAGCGSPPKERFYTLSAAGVAANVTAAEARDPVVVGPVTLPEVVDRPQLVVRVGANEVAILEQHRWAEPLKSEIPRLIARTLSQLLGTSRVSAYPESTSQEAHLRVAVDILRFEAAPGIEVSVEALWSVRRLPDGKPITGRSVVREPIAGEGYDAVVAAYGRALATLSRDIAQAVRTVGSMAH